MAKYRLIAFDTVLYNILVPELEKHGFHRWTSWWMRNWFDGHTERVVVNGSMCKWRPVTGGVLRAHYWDQHSLTSLPGTWTVGSSACGRHKCSLGKSAGDTRLCGAIDVQEGKDPSRGIWTGGPGQTYLINFNRAEYKIPHLGRSNPGHKYKLDGEWIESSSKKGFRVLLNKLLDL